MAHSASLPPVVQDVGFWLPSGNIVCAAGPLIGAQSLLPLTRGAGLLCVVFSAGGLRGQKTWYMRRTGRAGVQLVVGNIRTERIPFLDYGRAWGRFGFHCVSRRTGLTCRNRSGHGFFLSRDVQRIF